MRTAISKLFTQACLISMTCGAVACSADPSMGPADPAEAGLFSADPGKSDGRDPIAALYDNRAFLSAAGIVMAELDTPYTDQLDYDLPAAGVNLVDGFIDETPGLGIPENSFTQLAVYRIHKRADQVGALRVEHNGALAIRMARREVGSHTTRSAWVDRKEPIDFGNVHGEADFCIMVGPGGVTRGSSTAKYTGLRFKIVDPTK